MNKRARIVCAVAAAAVLAPAVSSFGALVTLELPANNGPFIYPVSSTDLLQAATVSSTGTFVREGSGGPEVLKDGQFRINGGNPSDNSLLTTAGIEEQVTFTLDTTTNTLGYDLTAIAVYGGWNDGGRDQQVFTVEYAKVGAPNTFLALDSQSVQPANADGGISPILSAFSGFNPALTNVVALRFDFGAVENGYVGYGEIDVAGVPSIIPEPTGAALGLAAAFGVSAAVRRRRIR